jgi:preprotein translocase subunit SecG
MGIVTGLVMLAFLAACVLLVLIVLVQKPQGGGLAGAFGSGAGSGQTAFGTRTGDVLTLTTIIIFVLYLATAVGLTFAIRGSFESAESGVSSPVGSDQGAAPTTDAPTGGSTAPTAPAITPAAPEGINPPPAAPISTPASQAPASPEKPGN